MNGLKLLVSALVAVLAIIVFGTPEVIAWREGSFELVGTLVGGYGAASGAQVLGPAAGASDYLFGGHGHDRIFL